MMALHVGLRRQRQVASIVGYSGMLTGAQELAHVPIRKPPVLLVHGDADPIVPVSALQHAQTELERLGVPVTSHVSRGLGHSVDETGLRLGQDFSWRVWPLMSQDYDHGQRDGLRLVLALLAAEEQKWAAQLGKAGRIAPTSTAKSATRPCRWRKTHPDSADRVPLRGVTGGDPRVIRRQPGPVMFRARPRA
jgi:phospholipase/carboxylesterase